MGALETFLDQNGLPAAALLMLVKAAGVPVPIPGDVVLLAVAARAASGNILVGQAFLALLVAMVLGGLIQFLVARGPARGLVYRVGPRLGLSPVRLDSLAARMRNAGTLAVGTAILTPGVRVGAVPACGLAALPLRRFGVGLVLGTAVDLVLHFAIGYAGGSVLARMDTGVWLPVGLVLVVLAVGIIGWAVIRRRQRPNAAPGEVLAAALGAWQSTACPACLVLGATGERLATPGHAHVDETAPLAPAT